MPQFQSVSTVPINGLVMTMISEHIFEMPQFDGSSIKLLWKNTTIHPSGLQQMNAQTITFDYSDYSMLLIVTKKLYYSPGISTEELTGSTAICMLTPDLDGKSQVLGGCPRFIQNASINVSGNNTYEGFFRTATVTKEGLSISNAQWKYGTYTGPVNINCFVIPTMIYGIR